MLAAKLTPNSVDFKKHEKTRITELRKAESWRPSARQAEREFSLREAEMLQRRSHKEIQSMVSRVARQRGMTYVLKRLQRRPINLRRRSPELGDGRDRPGGDLRRPSQFRHHRL